LSLTQVPVQERAGEIAAWRAMRGITHVSINTMGLGLARPEDHLRTLERFKKDVLS
jgi:hypothetical protein